MIVNNQFDFGDLVYFLTDPDQQGWYVTGIMIDVGETRQYRLSCGMEACTAYEFEITKEKQLVV